MTPNPTVYLTDSEQEWISEKAEEKDTSFSGVIREAIAEKRETADD